MILELLLLLFIAWMVWLYVQYWQDSYKSSYLQSPHQNSLNKPGCSVCLNAMSANAAKDSATGVSAVDGSSALRDSDSHATMKTAPVAKTATRPAEGDTNNSTEGAVPRGSKESDRLVRITGQSQSDDLENNPISSGTPDLRVSGNASGTTERSSKPASAAGRSSVPASTEKHSSPPANTTEHSRVKPLFTTPAHKDDLKQIKGIGKVMEKTLNDLGVTTFDQLANFTRSDITRVTEALEGFSGRIERDRWVEQARSFCDQVPASS